MNTYSILPTSNVLITGISGFAGSFLAEDLISNKQCRVYGTVISDDNENINSIKNKVKLIKCNLKDSKNVEDVIKESNPDFIFHLAALPSPADSFNNVSETIINNILAEVSILEAVRINLLPKKNPRILIVASADEYGLIKHDTKINEDTELNPTSPYSVSKIAQDYLGLQYFNAHKMEIVRVRPFNHIGPRQSPSFVVSSFAKQIAEIEKGYKNSLMVGNLEAIRDFTDVRDMVNAYVLALEKCKTGEVYNLGSGNGYKIYDLLKQLVALSTSKIEIITDSKRIRPVDIPSLICDNFKFHNITDWKAKIKIEKTLQDVLNYWREKTL